MVTRYTRDEIHVKQETVEHSPNDLDNRASLSLRVGTGTSQSAISIHSAISPALLLQPYSEHYGTFDRQMEQYVTKQWSARCSGSSLDVSIARDTFRSEI